jgi:hypothetical protein
VWMYEECSGRETEDVNEREIKGDLIMSERGKSGIDGRSHGVMAQSGSCTDLID